MYGHAFQSFVWNHMLSVRLELFGDKPVEGDLIIEDSPSLRASSSSPLKKKELSKEEVTEEEDEICT